MRFTVVFAEAAPQVIVKTVFCLTGPVETGATLPVLPDETNIGKPLTPGILDMVQLAGRPCPVQVSETAVPARTRRGDAVKIKFPDVSATHEDPCSVNPLSQVIGAPHVPQEVPFHVCTPLPLLTVQVRVSGTQIKGFVVLSECCPAGHTAQEVPFHPYPLAHTLQAEPEAPAGQTKLTVTVL